MRVRACVTARKRKDGRSEKEVQVSGWVGVGARGLRDDALGGAQAGHWEERRRGIGRSAGGALGGAQAGRAVLESSEVRHRFRGFGPFPLPVGCWAGAGEGARAAIRRARTGAVSGLHHCTAHEIKRPPPRRPRRRRWQRQRRGVRRAESMSRAVANLGSDAGGEGRAAVAQAGKSDGTCAEDARCCGRGPVERSPFTCDARVRVEERGGYPRTQR
jgi:hypothetical protein